MAVDKESKAPPSFQTFLDWVNSGIQLPTDKQAAFRGMCRFPLPTTSLCNSIFEEYEKIFMTQDWYRDYQLMDDTMRMDFKEYIEKTLNVAGYFKHKGFEAYKKYFNSIFVVDVPAQQTTPRPQPYFYRVAVKDLIDIRVERNIDNSDRIGYVIYLTGKNRAVILDDLFYRVAVKQDNADEWMIQFQALHTLNYCPACFFSLNHFYDEGDNGIARKIILSDSVGNLDWLLFYKIAERMYETYGPFPIITVPKSNCEYVEPGTGTRCTNGVIINTRDGKLISAHCPVCTKNNLVGPGSIFTKPVPRSKDDAVLNTPVEITPADVKSLEYISDKIDFLEWEIYADCVGSDDQTVQKEAVNQKQVQSNVEGKRNILMRVKKDFEQAEKFIVDTCGKIMYGPYYLDSVINYGEQFLLFTAGDVTDQFMTQKKAGLPNFIVSQKKQLLIQTEYKNNPYELQRAELLNKLEPWPDMSLTEAQTYQLNILFPEKFLLKLDFANFVSSFELVNGDIVSWGSALSASEKINRLTKILTDNASKESQAAKPLPAAGQGPGSSGSTQKQGTGT
jgi:hypothetical protein